MLLKGGAVLITQQLAVERDHLVVHGEAAAALRLVRVGVGVGVRIRVRVRARVRVMGKSRCARPATLL